MSLNIQNGDKRIEVTAGMTVENVKQHGSVDQARLACVFDKDGNGTYNTEEAKRFNEAYIKSYGQFTTLYDTKKYDPNNEAEVLTAIYNLGREFEEVSDPIVEKNKEILLAYGLKHISEYVASRATVTVENIDGQETLILDFKNQFPGRKPINSEHKVMIPINDNFKPQEIDMGFTSDAEHHYFGLKGRIELGGDGGIIVDKNCDLEIKGCDGKRNLIELWGPNSSIEYSTGDFADEIFIGDDRMHLERIPRGISSYQSENFIGKIVNWWKTLME